MRDMKAKKEKTIDSKEQLEKEIVGELEWKRENKKEETLTRAYKIEVANLQDEIRKEQRRGSFSSK